MIDKEKVKKEFSRHAQEYDRYALLQAEIGQKLVAGLDLEPRNILELGCGTGRVTLALAEKFPGAQIYATDISAGMLQEAQRKAVQQNQRSIIFNVEDMEFPAYPEESFDLVISNASLQWANHLALTFERIYKLLAKGGCFLFSIYGERSLWELRQAAKHAFGSKYDYEQTFLKAEAIERSLEQAGFSQAELSSDLVERQYDSVEHLMRTLKHTGAQNASATRPQRLIPKHELNELFDFYENNFKIRTKIKATYEIIYGRGLRAGD